MVHFSGFLISLITFFRLDEDVDDDDDDSFPIVLTILCWIIFHSFYSAGYVTDIRESILLSMFSDEGKWSFHSNNFHSAQILIFAYISLMLSSSLINVYENYFTFNTHANTLLVRDMKVYTLTRLSTFTELFPLARSFNIACSSLKIINGTERVAKLKTFELFQPTNSSTWLRTTEWKINWFIASLSSSSVSSWA